MHSKSLKEVLSVLKTDKNRGLLKADANERLRTYGENKLSAKKKKSIGIRFLEQFKDVMILILLLAAVISFFVALNSGESSEFFEPVLIVAIVVLNAIMGIVQESRAEKALEALKNMSAPHAKVIRDGMEATIEAALLIPGDLILLEAGDFIPADARLLESASLKVEESALTGESVPAEKDYTALVEQLAPIGDRLNMVYSGCFVTYGRGKAVVTATGMQTEMGRIASLLEGEKKEQTPLQCQLTVLGKYLGALAVIICIVIFAMGVLSGMELMDILMISVSLAVSAIPEGLPAIVTIVLSLGVFRMAKRNAIIKRLPAVETLGSASIICSDKTGTLTQNRMTLVRAYSAEEDILENICSRNTKGVKRLLQYATLCCDGSITMDGEKEVHIGDPTETSIVKAAYQNGIIKAELAKKYERIAEIPFDSDRKLMTVVIRMDGTTVVIVKGGFDVLSEKCIAGDIKKGKEITEMLSEEALRVLAIAYKVIDTLPSEITSEQLENGLTFMGVVGMIDPPREEAKEAVRICKEAGIKPIMITGDHIVTASAIAKQLGILENDDIAVTGTDLQIMPEDELDQKIKKIAVYARVSPENKIRIVKAWQKQNEIVSMTGDGVNDAPALKAADIGCAMGVTGTDVAKGAADMILADDNFATIVEAVKEGRGIYDNIKKTVGFLLSTNIGEVITVFFAMMIWRQSPLLSMQLLWINLVTDSLPAIALGMEPVESDIMKRRPRPKQEGIFAGGLFVRIILQGALFGILSLFAFYYGCGFDVTEESIAEGRTMAFAVLALSQLTHAFNMRSNKSIFKIGIFSNKMLNYAVLISLALMLAILLIPPVAYLFGLVLLEPVQYLIIICLALVPIGVLEFAKLFGLEKKNDMKS